MATQKPQRSPEEVEDLILRKIFCEGKELKLRFIWVTLYVSWCGCADGNVNANPMGKKPSPLLPLIYSEVGGALIDSYGGASTSGGSQAHQAGAKSLVTHKWWMPPGSFLNGRLWRLLAFWSFLHISALPDTALFKSQPDVGEFIALFHLYALVGYLGFFFPIAVTEA
ncbi:putative ubiquitin conjugation factor E4 [Bienertia sinuspersici]